MDTAKNRRRRGVKGRVRRGTGFYLQVVIRSAGAMRSAFQANDWRSGIASCTAGGREYPRAEGMCRPTLNSQLSRRTRRGLGRSRIHVTATVSQAGVAWAMRLPGMACDGTSTFTVRTSLGWLGHRPARSQDGVVPWRLLLSRATEPSSVLPSTILAPNVAPSDR